MGLSPRGRGNLGGVAGDADYAGSIPAWAGQPDSNYLALGPSMVYPRVGGATMSGEAAAAAAAADGLSPRGRGNPLPKGSPDNPTGSIPAWAGQPSRDVCNALNEAVYPRVGGATSLSARPRSHGQGLSPRGRGNLPTITCKMGWKRSIPAWAGQPTSQRRYSGLARVYPRVGGATSPNNMTLNPQAGLSPRGRGNLCPMALRQQTHRSIPAWAGQPQVGEAGEPRGSVYPRVGGATRFHQYQKSSVGGLSPVGGATSRPRRSPEPPVGLSPRGRGNLVIALLTGLNLGSIPAWAGQPILR